MLICKLLVRTWKQLRVYKQILWPTLGNSKTHFCCNDNKITAVPGNTGCAQARTSGEVRKNQNKSNQIRIGKEVKGQLYKQYIIRHTASFNCYFCQNLNANIYFCKQCLFFTRWTISAIHNMNAYRELTIWCTYKVHMSFEIQSA